MNKKETAEFYKTKMQTDMRWLERALIAIYNKQTEDEQDNHAVSHDNGMGFTQADANYLTWAAKFVMGINRPEGQRLNCSQKMIDNHVPKVRKRMMKYAGQLVRIVEAKNK